MLTNVVPKTPPLAFAVVLFLTTTACAQEKPADKKAEGTVQEVGKVPEPVVLGLREMLYCDKTLDQFLESGDPEHEELKRPLALVGEGDWRGALKLLEQLGSRAEVRASMDYWFILAQARRAGGDTGGARRAVRGVFSIPNVETRAVIQAWAILRELGERPAEAEARNVLGVVVEIGDEEAAVIVAGYDDGTYRFFSTSGGGLIGSPVDEAAIKAAKNLTRLAGPLAAGLPYDNARPLPKPGRVRYTLLTPGGARATEEGRSAAESGMSKLSPLYSSAVQLLGEMLRIGREGGQ